MPYWLTNADHGTMPVYDPGEVERVKKFGWTLLNVGESPDHATTLKDALAESMRGHGEIVALPVVDQPEKRKPGRPPKAK